MSPSGRSSTRTSCPYLMATHSGRGSLDSFGFQVIAGEGVGAAAWMYHCPVQSRSDTGLVGLCLVKKADGTIPGYAPREH